MQKSGIKILKKIIIVLIFVFLAGVVLVILCFVGCIAYNKISFELEAKKYEVVADYTYVGASDDPFQIEISYNGKLYRILPKRYDVVSEPEEAPFGINRITVSSRLYRFRDITDESFICFLMGPSSWDWDDKLNGEYYNTAIDIPSPTAENIDRIEIIRYLRSPESDGKAELIYTDRDEIVRIMSSDEQTLENEFADETYDTLIRAYFKGFAYLGYKLCWIYTEKS